MKQLLIIILCLALILSDIAWANQMTTEPLKEQVLSDGDVTVTGDFCAGTKLKVSTTNELNGRTYHIDLIQDGSIVQPSELVNVKIKLPEIYNNQVYHLYYQGKPYPAKQSGNILTFQTDHFSDWYVDANTVTIIENAKKYTLRMNRTTESRKYSFAFRLNGVREYSKIGMTVKSINGEYVFCTQPLSTAAPNPMIPKKLALNTEQKRRLETAWYQWGLTKKTTRDYILMQMYVWHIMYPSLRWEIYPGTITKKEFLNYINSRERYYEEFWKKPSWDGTEVTLIKGQTQKLDDKNKVIHSYRISSTPKEISLSQKADRITLTGKLPSHSNTLTFRRVSSKYQGMSLVYVNPSSQNVGLFRLNEVPKATLNVSVRDVNYEIEVSKVDLEKNPLEGATIGLFDSSLKLLSKKLTPKEGILRFKVPDKGTYFIKELKAPKGYQLNPTEVKVSVEKEGTSHVTLDNKPITGGIEITKTDISDGKPLPDTTIAIYTSNDKEVEKKVTDEKGKVLFKELLAGDYYFLETKAPDGYEINTEKHPFSIVENGVIVKDHIEDVKKTGLAYLKKFCSKTNQPLEGAVYSLFDNNDTLVSIFTTDKTGSFSTKLPYGKYYVKETTAPNGYLIDEQKHYFELSEETSEATLTLKDHPAETDLIINKIDSKTNKPLKDTSFKIYKSDNSLIGVYKTNEKGQVKITLPFGEYFLKEVIAPEGYIKDDAKHTFRLDSLDHKVVTIKNQKAHRLPPTGQDVSPFLLLGAIGLVSLGMFLVNKNSVQ